MKINYLLLSLFAICNSLVGMAQTVLSTGDVAFVGFQSGYAVQAGNPSPKDRFAFVLLKDVAANTEILLSDNAVKSTSPIRLCNNESTIIWTSLADLNAGTVVVITESDTNASSGKVKGSIGLSQSGDAILAFQKVGSDTIPLAAIGNMPWLGTCLGATGTCGGANNNTTCLPSPLDNTNSMNLDSDSNNFIFNMPTFTGTPNEIRDAIANPANWILSNHEQIWTASSWGFSVTVSNKAVLKESSFVLSPNPTTGTLKISGGEFAGIRVSNALGKSVLVKYDHYSKELDTKSLSEGLYFVSILGTDNKVIQISRIMKR